MNKIFICLLLAVTFVAHAQPNPVTLSTIKPDTITRQLAECGTPSLSPEQAEMMLNSIRELEPQLKKMRTATTPTVSIRFHVVVSPTNYAIKQPLIYEFLKGLNIAFEPVGIQFGQYGGASGINFIEEGGKYFDFNRSDEDDLCGKYDERNAINVYLVNTIDGSETTGGYAKFDLDNRQHPSNASYSLSDRKYNRIVIALRLSNNGQNYSQPTIDGLANRIIPHEMGHYFGLLHTFHPDHNEKNGGLCGDCNRTGDLICDTPPQANQPEASLVPNGECNKPYSECGSTWVSGPFNNMMSYFYGCGQVFTYQQRERMRYWGYYLRTRLSDSIDTRYYIDGNNHIAYKPLSTNLCAGQKVRFQLVQFGEWKWQDLQRLQMEISGPGVPRQLLPLTIIDNKTAEGTIPITAGSGQHDIRVTDRFSQTVDFEPVSKITINAQPQAPTIALTTQGLLSSAAVGNQWYVNGTALAGQNSPLLSATQSGAISVGVNVGGCTALSQPFVITATEPLPSVSQIVAFPNPASQSIQVKGLVPGSVRVSAVDLSGKVLSQSWYAHNQGTVSFPIKQSFGKVFLLKVENENRTWSQRIAVADL